MSKEKERIEIKIYLDELRKAEMAWVAAYRDKNKEISLSAKTLLAKINQILSNGTSEYHRFILEDLENRRQRLSEEAFKKDYQWLLDFFQFSHYLYKLFTFRLEQLALQSRLSEMGGEADKVYEKLFRACREIYKILDTTQERKKVFFIGTPDFYTKFRYDLNQMVNRVTEEISQFNQEANFPEDFDRNVITLPETDNLNQKIRAVEAGIEILGLRRQILTGLNEAGQSIVEKARNELDFLFSTYAEELRGYALQQIEKKKEELRQEIYNHFKDVSFLEDGISDIYKKIQSEIQSLKSFELHSMKTTVSDRLAALGYSLPRWGEIIKYAEQVYSHLQIPSERSRYALEQAVKTLELYSTEIEKSAPKILEETMRPFLLDMAAILKKLPQPKIFSTRQIDEALTELHREKEKIEADLAMLQSIKEKIIQSLPFQQLIRYGARHPLKQTLIAQYIDGVKLAPHLRALNEAVSANPSVRLESGKLLHLRDRVSQWGKWGERLSGFFQHAPPAKSALLAKQIENVTRTLTRSVS